MDVRKSCSFKLVYSSPSFDFRGGVIVIKNFLLAIKLLLLYVMLALVMCLIS